MALTACTAPAEHPALKVAQLPPLIQAHRFVYRPDRLGGYQLSPDGRKLAWSGSAYLRKALFVRNNDTGAVQRYPVLGGAFQWTHDGRRLLTTAADTEGAENTHVFMLDTDDKSARAVVLTPTSIRARKHCLRKIPAMAWRR